MLDTDDTSPYPAREKVTFTEPGTYDYYCVIHGNAMKGEIVVEG